MRLPAFLFSVLAVSSALALPYLDESQVQATPNNNSDAADNATERHQSSPLQTNSTLPKYQEVKDEDIPYAPRPRLKPAKAPPQTPTHFELDDEDEDEVANGPAPSSSKIDFEAPFRSGNVRASSGRKHYYHLDRPSTTSTNSGLVHCERARDCPGDAACLFGVCLYDLADAGRQVAAAAGQKDFSVVSSSGRRVSRRSDGCPRGYTRR